MVETRWLAPRRRQSKAVWSACRFGMTARWRVVVVGSESTLEAKSASGECDHRRRRAMSIAADRRHLPSHTTAQTGSEAACRWVKQIWWYKDDTMRKGDETDLCLRDTH
jgi:hypothetical protein